MENKDLKWIKANYGEDFCWLCQCEFSSILKKEGMLPKILKEHFLPSRELYEDIVGYDRVGSFRDYLYSLVKAEENMTKLGLTLENSYRMFPVNSTSFRIPYYVQATDGKFYKYNQEIPNIYYCSNNIIIQDEKVYHFNKDKCILFDHFILDFEKNEIIDYNLIQGNHKLDSFPESVGEIKDIKRVQGPNGLTIQITPESGELVEITLNKKNQIIGYSNSNVKKVDDYFLRYNKTLTCINLLNVEEIGDDFLTSNESITSISLPKVKRIGRSFLYHNESLTSVNLPNVKEISDSFLNRNKSLTSINLPNVREIGDDFLASNESITSINLPKLENLGKAFLLENKSLRTLNLPNVEKLGEDFLRRSKSIISVNLPKLKQIGGFFLEQNKSKESVNLSNIKKNEVDLSNRDRLLENISDLLEREV